MRWHLSRGLLMYAVFAMPVSAAPRAFVDPPRFNAITDGAKAAPSATHQGCSANYTVDAAGQPHYQLVARWTDPMVTSVANPGADPALHEPSRDQLRLRSYNGCLSGPVIETAPGKTLFVDMANELNAGGVADPTCQMPVHNQPNCFNTLNLHFHGYHGSPRSEERMVNGQKKLIASDDVFIETQPGGRQSYEYVVGPDHPAGTFWYHAHRHGSTAVQVSSGMVGPLIVRGSRTVADVASHGAKVADIDTILPQTLVRERIWTFEQISYACLNSANHVITRASLSSGSTDPTWHCADTPARGSTVGTVQNFEEQIGGPGDWDRSGRYTLVNGEVAPSLGLTGNTIAAGDVERWRLIHGGIRDAINMHIVAVTDGPEISGLVAAQMSRLSASDRVRIAQLTKNARPPSAEEVLGSILPRLMAPRDAKLAAALLRSVCAGNVVRQVAIAEDGLTRTAARERSVTYLQPGYRSDVLVTFPKAGLYCVLDEAAPGAARPGPGAAGGFAPEKSVKLLATVQVTGGHPLDDINTSADTRGLYVRDVMRQVATMNASLPKAVAARVLAGNLADFAFAVPYDAPGDPAPDQADRHLNYLIQFDPSGAPSGFGWTDTADGSGFSQHKPDVYPFQPILGSTETWHLSADFTHIHHVHVNPFQIVDVEDGGASIFQPGGSCDKLASADPSIVAGDADLAQYCDLQGVYKDTIFVKGSGSGSSPKFVVVVRTKYEDFTGAFVLHCHILDHEDQGMMANVCIHEAGKPCVPGPHGLATTSHAHMN